MKVKTSITLTEELLSAIDNLSEKRMNRSKFIEKAVRYFIEKKEQQERDSKDIEIINKNCERLNREAREVLSFQVDL